MTDIFFLAPRGDPALPWSAAVQLGLNVRFGERQPWRAAIDYHPHCATVRFAPGCNTKQMPKGVPHTLAPSSPASSRLCFGGSIRRGQWCVKHVQWTAPFGIIDSRSWALAGVTRAVEHSTMRQIPRQTGGGNCSAQHWGSQRAIVRLSTTTPSSNVISMSIFGDEPG